MANTIIDISKCYFKKVPLTVLQEKSTINDNPAKPEKSTIDDISKCYFKKVPLMTILPMQKKVTLMTIRPMQKKYH